MRLALLITICLGYFSSFAGDSLAYKNTKYSLGLGCYRGFVTTQSDRVANLGAHTLGFEINLIQQTAGAQYWQGLFHYPKIGCSLLYYDFGLPNITGHAVAILPYMQFKVISSRYGNIEFQAGSGVGYLNKIFDVKTNYKNKAVSTHINMAMLLGMYYTVNINSKINAFAGVGINHFSNAAFTLPNNGINIPCFRGGVNYYFNEDKNTIKAVPKDVFSKSYYAYTALSFGKKEDGLVGRWKYYPMLASGLIGRQFSRKNRAGLGIDIYYDKSLAYTKLNAHEINHRADSFFQTGLRIEHEFIFGKMSFISTFGTYFYTPSAIDGVYYQKLGVLYYFTPKIFGGFTMKTHFGRADFFEVGMGYRLK
ncbi:MAG: acyloxyacyl hydrolase [Bacteroidetes bacterium]|nr:acyloxyacyl hydrolase [Bacteroidota bacterium]